MEGKRAAKLLSEGWSEKCIEVLDFLEQKYPDKRFVPDYEGMDGMSTIIEDAVETREPGQTWLRAGRREIYDGDVEFLDDDSPELGYMVLWLENGMGENLGEVLRF